MRNRIQVEADSCNTAAVVVVERNHNQVHRNLVAADTEKK